MGIMDKDGLAKNEADKRTRAIGDDYSDGTSVPMHTEVSDGGEASSPAVGNDTTEPRQDADASEVAGIRPAMMRSQPILPHVAERIIEESHGGGDGGEDLLHRISRVRRRVSDALRDRVPEEVADGAGQLASRVVARTSRAFDEVSESVSRIRGDRSFDSFNLGIEYLRMMAGMVGRMADLSNDGIASDTATMLLDAAEWVDGGYLDAASAFGSDVAVRMGERVARNLSTAWEWLYANVMSCCVPKPLSEAGAGLVPDASILPAARHRDLMPVMGIPQRVEQGWDDGDLLHMSGQGLRDLAGALDRFARSTVSWPDEYPDSPVLSTRGGDEWADCQYWDLLSFVHGDSQGAQTTVEHERDGKTQTYHTVKTNREMGLPFAAWTDDCHAAARTLDLWADCNDGTGNSRVLLSVMSPDERREMENLRKRAWDWLGEHVLDIVC